MGSGNSRLNAAEGEAVPPKIRPTLIGRFEEFRKGRNGEGTLSKKQLLKDAEEEDDNSQSSHEIETEDNSNKDSTKEIQPTKEETVVVRVIAAEKLSRVVPVPNSECETEKEKDPIKDNVEQANKDIDPNQDEVIHADEKVEAKVKTQEGNTAEPVEVLKPENEQEVSAKSDDDDGDKETEEFGRFLCPGSPSFRIYCIEPEKGKEEEECKSPTIFMHQKSRSAESVEISASRNSRTSNEVHQVVEMESSTKRKGNKMKKLGAVKTLLKVKSCYHPMCTCTGDHLVAAKAAN